MKQQESASKQNVINIIKKERLIIRNISKNLADKLDELSLLLS